MIKVEKESFIYGMVTAFCECIFNDNKKIALSPVLNKEMFDKVNSNIEKIVNDSYLKCYLEKNEDVKNNIYCYYVIYKYDSNLVKYLDLRKKGYNVFDNFSCFKEILTYNIVSNLEDDTYFKDKSFDVVNKILKVGE